MSRKNKAKRERRLSQEFWQPEDMAPLLDLPPQNKFAIACSRKGLKQLQAFVEKLPHTQYNAFWRVINFFVMKPKRDGKHLNAGDEEILEELTNINNNLLNPQLLYMFKKRIRAVMEADERIKG